MSQVSYDNLEKRIRDTFYKSRSKRYGFTVGQSTDYTLVQFERITERSELEHLVVFLTMGKILLDEQVSDEELKQELVTHREKQTLERWKDHVEQQDYDRISSDLQNLIDAWV